MNRLRSKLLKSPVCLLSFAFAGISLLLTPAAHAQSTASAAATETAAIEPAGTESYSKAIYVEGTNGHTATYASYSVMDFAVSSFNIAGAVTSASNVVLNMWHYNPSGSVSGTVNFFITADTTDSIASGQTAITYLTGNDPAYGFPDGLAISGTANFTPYYYLTSFGWSNGVANNTIEPISMPLSGTALSVFMNQLTTSGTIRFIVASDDPTNAIYAEWDSLYYEATPTLTFNYTSNLASLNWKGGSGTWDNSTAAWLTGTTGSLYTWNPAAQADFLTINGTGAGTVTLGAPITANGLSFTTGGYTIAGSGANTLTLSGTAVGDNFISTSDTTTATTISAKIVGTLGIDKIGYGGLYLTNTSNSFTGGVTITGGTIYINNDAELGDPSNYVDLAEATGTSSLAITSSVTLGASRDIYGSGNIDVYPGQVLDITGAVGPLLGAAPAGEFYLVDSGTVIFDGTSINPNTISVSSSSTLIMNTPMTTPSAATLYYIEFTNDGYVYLNADNTSFAGRFDTVSGSKVTLVLGNANALGENQMYLNGGTIKAAAPYLVPTPASFSGTTTYSGADMEWSGQFTMYYESYSPQFKVYDHMTLDDGIILTGGTTNVDVQDRLIKSGTGTLTLLSSENEMSDLLLYNGTVEVGPSGNLGVGFVTGSSAVTLSATTTNATLLLDNADALDEITDNVIILNSATTSGIVDLNFASSGYDYINSITVNGTSYPSGVYNSTNLPGTLTGSGNLVIAPGGVAGYGTWQIDNFGSNASNIAISGPTANPAGDGVSNLMKYALDLNPNAPIVSGTFLTTGTTGTGLPKVALASGTLSLTYTQLVSPGDITYQTEWSTDLVNWSATGVSEAVLSSTTDSVSSAPLQTVQDSVAVSGSVGFIRLYVMQTNGTTVSTTPKGFVNITTLGNSDTELAIPLIRQPEFMGAITSVSGSTIVVSSSAQWTTNQLVYSGSAQPKTYYALIGANTSGSTGKQGSSYTITANSANSLTVNLNGDSISSVTAGTEVSVIPYWTLATVYPASASGTAFTASASSANRQSQVLIPNYAYQGINASAQATDYYLVSGTNNGWRQFSRPVGEDHSNDVLLPNQFYIFRNGSLDATGTLTVLGAVQPGEQTVMLTTTASAAQDNYVCIQRPVPYTLNQSGLISSGAFTASTSSANRIDQIFTYNNTVAGINQSAAATYYYISSGTNVGWRKFPGAATADVGSTQLPAGFGFVIRKGTSTGATAYWTHTPTYQ